MSTLWGLSPTNSTLGGPAGSRDPAAASPDLHRARLRRSELEVDWRIADRVRSPDAKVRTLRRFAVEAGRPGLAEF